MKTLTKNILPIELRKAGQSPWLDQISRELLSSGKLKSLIRDSGLLGVTSNPTIFEKAISQKNGGYDADIRRLYRAGASTFEVYDALTISDIQKACDFFAPVFKSSKGEHGFVSLEVSPALAHEEEATTREARRLFKGVARSNVMIKVPATTEGIPAVRTLIGEGININITLVFSLKHYQDAAFAYIEGLRDWKKKGGDLSRVHSVASVFVSRIDGAIDKKLDAHASSSQQILVKAEIENLKGKAAVANSKKIYQEFKKIFYGRGFQELKKSGAAIQKVLWGSTSAKNPAYPDLIYVENLIGPETVNTMPQATLEAFLDHGTVRPNSLEENLPEAEKTLAELSEIGIDIDKVCAELQRDGVKSFAESFDSLMKTLELARETVQKSPGSKAADSVTIKVDLGNEKWVKERWESTLSKFEEDNYLSRFFAADPGVWKADASHAQVIKNRLGWLRSPEWMLGKFVELEALQAEAAKEKITDVVLLGMGGSSLAPEVMSLLCKKSSRAPRFHVLDTTDAAAILGVEKKIAIRKTIFIVASKSGSTLETLSQFHYFYDKVSKLYPSPRPNRGQTSIKGVGRHFVAITDRGSSLEKLAREKHFRKTFINPADIGGRYSALSFFGLVPAALLGIDVRRIVRSSRGLLAKAKTETVLSKNLSFSLGVLLGELARIGRDKVMLRISDSLAPFGAWLEQLIAESTGKEGKGIIPVNGDFFTGISPEEAQDRVYIVMQIKGERLAGEHLKAVNYLKKTGLPVIHFEWGSGEAIGGEFLRWEIAAAAASSVLGVNPFDEPNVTESKENTSQLLDAYKRTRTWEGASQIHPVSKKIPLENLFAGLGKGSYLALLIYGERSVRNSAAFGALAETLSKRFKAPVIVGFGPRYLHSIGQLYKGGPKKGLFLEFFCRNKKDAAIPGAGATFEDLKMAQALGDFKALKKRDLPAIFVDLGVDIASGIARFKKQIVANGS